MRAWVSRIFRQSELVCYNQRITGTLGRSYIKTDPLAYKDKGQ